MADISTVSTMLAKDAVSAKMATAYVTIDNNRYLLFQAKNLSASLEKTKVEVPILGRMSVGHKSTSCNGTGNLTIYYNTNLFTNLLKTFKDSGVDTYFDLQTTVKDPTSSAGSMTITLKDCNIDGGLITAFDADGDWLEQEIDFTFEDWEVGQSFTELDGMSTS